MRGRLTCLVAAGALLTGGAATGSCTKAPAPSEDVSSSTLPPITICYEPDGAPCPLLDGGGDGGDESDATETGDAGDAGPG